MTVLRFTPELAIRGLAEQVVLLAADKSGIRSTIVEIPKDRLFERRLNVRFSPAVDVHSDAGMDILLLHPLDRRVILAPAAQNPPFYGSIPFDSLRAFSLAYAQMEDVYRDAFSLFNRLAQSSTSDEAVEMMGPDPYWRITSQDLLRRHISPVALERADQPLEELYPAR